MLLSSMHVHTISCIQYIIEASSSAEPPGWRWREIDHRISGYPTVLFVAMSSKSCHVLHVLLVDFLAHMFRGL